MVKRTTTTNQPFPFLLQDYLIPRAREEALNGDCASGGGERGLHHATHKRVNQRWGNLSALLHLLQNLDRRIRESLCVMRVRAKSKDLGM